MWKKVNDEWGEYLYRVEGTDIDPVKKGMRLFGTPDKPGKIFCTLDDKTKEVILVKINPNQNDTR